MIVYIRADESMEKELIRRQQSPSEAALLRGAVPSALALPLSGGRKGSTLPTTSIRIDS